MKGLIGPCISFNCVIILIILENDYLQNIILWLENIYGQRNIKKIILLKYVLEVNKFLLSTNYIKKENKSNKE